MNLGRKSLLPVLLLTALMTVGILPAWGTWVTIERRWISGDKFEVDVPAGWLLRGPVEDQMILTRDGVWLQVVTIERVSIEKELSNVKKPLVKSMLPEEISELIAQDLGADKTKLNLQILERATTDVGGHPGFKLVYSYEISSKLKKTGVCYGALVDAWYYYLNYEGPSRHYFPRDRETFERLKDTFKITL